MRASWSAICKGTGALTTKTEHAGGCAISNAAEQVILTVSEVKEMHGWDGWGWPTGGLWMMILMALFWLLFTVGIVLIVLWVANRFRGPVAASGDSALDIIKQRYARGEIDRDEFERMRQELS